jgi:chemotaxis signal transduction protein
MIEKAGKYLTFSLAGEEYGIGILVDSVSEVLNIKGEDIEPSHLRRQAEHGLHPGYGQDGRRS